MNELRPTATLSEIGDVIDRVRAANRLVDVHIDGDLAGLPPDVSRAAYRIVQEALTNVLKHSSPDAPTDVFVSRSASELCLRIETAGDAVTVSSRDHPVGNGLIGMRERATALGGTFTAAPQPTGGFLVAATLPLPVAVS